MGRKRIRAHANPMADHDFDIPTSPDAMDWISHFPAYFPTAGADHHKHEVTIADIGCGFGGLSVRLAQMFPDKLTIGMEIRPRVVEVVKDRITKLRAEHSADNAADSAAAVPDNPNDPNNFNNPNNPKNPNNPNRSLAHTTMCPSCASTS